MTIRRPPLSHTLLALLLTALLAGCATPSPSPRLYLLSATATPLPDKAQAQEASGPASVGLGPISLPDYLDRPQIVTRATPNRLSASEGHRWAEPLTAGVTRVLSEQLGALLAPTPLMVHPWKQAEAPAVQLRLELLRFEAGPDRAFHLHARWTLAGPAMPTPAQPRHAAHDLPLDPTDHEAQVAAAGEALTRLAQDIAADLRRQRQH
ncbi:MAG: hypothetical protein BWK76_21190 [Desulfobulbaceae bacterium A2]|nr:MAG: hypothetical protein BWK76_21190 [Desulfobulbaceae bacterium A2]